MDLQQIAGIVVIAGFVLFLVSMFSAPPRLYQETDVGVRLQIIADHQSRFRTAQLSSGLSILVTAIGFLLLSLHLRGSHSPWLLNLGAGAFILSGILLLLYVNQTIADPRAYIESSGLPALGVAFVLLAAVAGILYGIVFLQGVFPAWLGYLMMGSGALLLVTLIFRSDVAYFLIILFQLVTLIAGILFIRQ